MGTSRVKARQNKNRLSVLRMRAREKGVPVSFLIEADRQARISERHWREPVVPRVVTTERTYKHNWEDDLYKPDSVTVDQYKPERKDGLFKRALRRVGRLVFRASVIVLFVGSICGA